MRTETRLFNCAGCCLPVQIGTYHDRGNRYCSLNCSKMARQKSLRAAGKRYQKTRKGKFKNAERQKRHRERQKKVTHHS
jgi:hypothetical protein